MNNSQRSEHPSMTNLLIDIGLMALGWVAGFVITRFLVAMDKRRKRTGRTPKRKAVGNGQDRHD